MNHFRMSSWSKSMIGWRMSKSFNGPPSPPIAFENRRGSIMSCSWINSGWYSDTWSLGF